MKMKKMDLTLTSLSFYLAGGASSISRRILVHFVLIIGLFQCNVYAFSRPQHLFQMFANCKQGEAHDVLIAPGYFFYE